MSLRNTLKDLLPPPNPYTERSCSKCARNLMIASGRMSGQTIRTLAAHYGLSPTHVHRIVRGVPVLLHRHRPPRKPRSINPERRMKFLRLKENARDLRRLGFSYREIARRLEVSPGFAFNASHMVEIRELRGRAWLSHQEGRPKQWKRELLAHTAAE